MNKKRIKKYLIIALLVIETITLFLTFKSIPPKEIKLEDVKLRENNIKNNGFAIMIQKEDGSGYDVYEENTWPTDGYEFNSELSGCIDNYGSIVENSMTYNKDTNIITIDTGVTASCYVYFDIRTLNGQYLSDAVMSLASESGSNVYNEGDAGYRYEGKEVDNYITFNNETWRIIGVEEGSKIGLTSGKYYTKIIREYNRSTDRTLFELPYDSDDDYANDWSTTSLYALLNGDYYNRSGDYASVGLTPEAKVLVTDANWYYTPIWDESEFTTSAWYTNERSDTTKVVKDAVGIMYPSDYGYAATQSLCGSIKIYSYDGYEQDVACSEYDWMFADEYYDSYVSQWTIIPWEDMGVFFVYDNISGSDASAAFAVRPVVYLDSDVKITNDGDGNINNKFTVSIDKLVVKGDINNNNTASPTMTIISNKAGTYCVNTSATSTASCTFTGSITANGSVTTSKFTTNGDYYVHVTDAAGNIGHSSKVTVTVSTPLGQYIIDNSISGLDKNLIGTDTLYRFSGTTGNTGINNYICLGTTEKCASGSDNMYRIIGVEPSTGYVKVIKQIKYGSNIKWHSTTGVTWPNSGAYSTMTTWYNSVSFKSMIVSHSWNIGEFTSYSTTRANALSADTGNTTTAYVGMLAVSDYYLAYKGDQNWNSSYSNYTSNWIHLANNGNTSDAEWTMSRYNSSGAWRVFSNGTVYYTYMDMYSNAVRPVFYLNSTVNRISGSGTSGDPFIVG